LLSATWNAEKMIMHTFQYAIILFYFISKREEGASGRYGLPEESFGLSAIFTTTR
jgi:hypothetical protein